MSTASRIINWGIIGCGDVCEIKSGPAFSKVEHSKLVAVMRRDIEKARDFADRHGVPKYYSKAEDLIGDAEVNAVYIATPPAFHEAYAIMAMEAGKPVYIEKPIALDALSCQRILDFSVKNNIPAVTAHYRRALPLFEKVKELLDQNIVGKIRLIDLKLLQSPTKNIIANSEENWRVVPELSGGGLFHDLAPHQLDILYWIFGEPLEVNGTSLNQAENYKAPDLASIGALFRDRVYFHGLWSFSVSPGNVADICTIVGEKGSLSFPFFGDPVLKITTESDTREIHFENPKHIQQLFIDQVVKFFRGEAENPCSVNEALVTMKIMDKVREFVEIGEIGS